MPHIFQCDNYKTTVVDQKKGQMKDKRLHVMPITWNIDSCEKEKHHENRQVGCLL